jgi:hypothetical protein
MNPHLVWFPHDASHAGQLQVQLLVQRLPLRLQVGQQQRHGLLQQLQQRRPFHWCALQQACTQK